VRFVQVDEVVWCDYFGEAHVDDPNPYGEPPVDTRIVDREEMEGDFYVEVEPEVWEFHCPGPHRPLFRQTKEEGFMEPKRVYEGLHDQVADDAKRAVEKLVAAGVDEMTALGLVARVMVVAAGELLDGGGDG